MSITFAVQLTPIFAIASSNKGSTSSGIELEVEELELLEELELEVEEELSFFARRGTTGGTFTG